MKRTNRLYAMLCASVFALSALPAAPASAEEAADLFCVTYSGSNTNRNDYSRWASPVTSALQPVSGGWMRVQGNTPSGKALVEYYSDDFTLTDRILIDMQLPVWGGFYAASDGNYYLITGQENDDHDDTLPVLDIAQYDSSWNLIKHVQRGNMKVAIPFDAGSMRCTDDGTWLVLRMAREMYSGHQANLTLLVRMSDLTVTEDDSAIQYLHMGYVSHSFNQYVLLDGTHIVGIDHGDAYPRAVVLNYYQSDYTTGSFMPDYFDSPCVEVNMLTFPEASDSANMYEVNYTGAAVGGFMQSSTHYIIAYNTVDQSKLSEYWEDYSGNPTRNIHIAAVPKNALKDDSVRDFTLTDIADGDPTAHAPQLVQLAEDRFAVLWQQENDVYITELDGSGAPLGEAAHFAGQISDCVPRFHDGKLVWYVWNSDTVTFYSVDPAQPDAPEITAYVGGHDYQQIGDADENGTVTLKCSKCSEEKTVTVPTDFRAYWNSSHYDNEYTYSSRIPDALDAGMYVKVQLTASAPDNPDVQNFIIESSDDSVLVARTPGTAYRIQTFDVNDFDEPQRTVTLRIHPEFNEKCVKEFTLTLAHSYETTASVRPTAEAEGYVEHTCSGCGHVYREVLPKLTDLSADSITVTMPEEPCVYDGTEHKPVPAVTLTQADGTEITLAEGTDYTVSYSDNLHAGTASLLLTASEESLYVAGSRTAAFTVSPQPLSPEQITLAENPGRDPEKVFAPDFTVKDQAGTVLTAEVDYLFAFSEDGTALTVTGQGDYTGNAVKTLDPKLLDISECTLTFADAEFNEAPETYYTGKEQTPDLIVADGERILRADQDYTVTYEKNVNAGTAGITVSGTGAYTGTLTGSFRILPLSIADDTAFTAALAEEGPFVFTGKQITPKVSVQSADGKTTLTEDEDFTLTYQKNLNAGAALITVSGAGNYTGKLELSFQIEPFAVTEENCKLVLEYDSAVYDGKEHIPAVTAVIGGESMNANFNLAYSNVINAGTAEVTADFIGNYTGTLMASYQILPMELTEDMLSLPDEPFIYNGSPIIPEILFSGETPWRRDLDYTVTCLNNVHAGTAKITVTGTRNYSGEIKMEMEILPYDFTDDADVRLFSESETWTGAPIVPEFSVHVNDQVLSEDSYTFICENNVDAGTATLTVTGTGDYTGTCTAEFVIAPHTLSAEELSLPEETYIFNGEEITPEVRYTGETPWRAGTDYTVTCEDNLHAGEATVTVTGKQNYTGTVTLHFEIQPLDLSEHAKAETDPQTFVYDGVTAFTPAVTVTDGDKLLTDADYTCTYSDNLNAGTASVLITFRGDYTGTAKAAFEILPADLSDLKAAAVITENGCTYDGKEKTPAVSLETASGYILQPHDYQLSYEDNTDAGEAAAVIEGTDNFTGSIRLPFTIAPAAIRSAELLDDNLVWDGTPLTPAAAVFGPDSEKLLGETDYTVRYANNDSPGIGIAKIEGIGNYTGTLTLEFTILEPETTTTTTTTTETTTTVTESTTASTETTASSSSESTETTTSVSVNDTETTTSATVTETETTSSATVTETETTTSETVTATETETTTASSATETETTTASTATETETTTVSTSTETETTTASSSTETETTTASTSTETETTTASSSTETETTTVSTSTETETTTASSSTETETTSASTETESTTTATETTEAPFYDPGSDYNGDGEVTLADAVLLAQFLAEDNTLTADQVSSVLHAEPDTDRDGLVTIADLRKLLHLLR